MGNIAGAAADLWSNESVQNIRLLSGSAPEAYLELLAYDCRLFNTAIESGEQLKLRDWLVQSDISHSAEALMLEPGAVIKIAKSIIDTDSDYARTVAAVETGFEIIKEHLISGKIKLSEMEMNWLDKLESAIESLPEDENEALNQVKDSYGDLFIPAAYGL